MVVINEKRLKYRIRREREAKEENIYCTVVKMEMKKERKMNKEGNKETLKSEEERTE